ncbi:MAG: hypothetical protein OEU09_10540 [Rhodospirillales bacterium]|nr:hypothetical protein [Rhodospirillales bacterium]MDH3917614.1 hypothetical protein [Rhodospirillales bacterium]MDH3970136.1 hypothetical protein [Rhodospirillales bacterium]
MTHFTEAILAASKARAVPLCAYNNLPSPNDPSPEGYGPQGEAPASRRQGSAQRGWRPKAPGPSGGAYRGSQIQDLGGVAALARSAPMK